MQPRSLLFAGLILIAPGVSAQSFTESLWTENRDIYQAILRHPFIRGLQDGSLDRRAFSFYLIQDAHYLRHFGRALEVVASKSPRKEWAALLRAHAADALREEQRLHRSVFQAYGITIEQVGRVEPAPEAFGYMNFLLATAHERPFPESIAALLPCYWIYAEVGRELKRTGSSNPMYQKWIDNYSSPEYQKVVDQALAITEEVAGAARDEERGMMRENFRRSSRYEWMFWDSAYHLRSWPPEPQ